MNSFLPQVIKNKLSVFFAYDRWSCYVSGTVTSFNTFFRILWFSSVASPSFFRRVVLPLATPRCILSPAPPLCPCHLQSCCKSRQSLRTEREEHNRDRDTAASQQKRKVNTRSHVVIRSIIGICQAIINKC